MKISVSSRFSPVALFSLGLLFIPFLLYFVLSFFKPQFGHERNFAYLLPVLYFSSLLFIERFVQPFPFLKHGILSAILVGIIAWSVISERNAEKTDPVDAALLKEAVSSKSLITVVDIDIQTRQNFAQLQRKTGIVTLFPSAQFLGLNPTIGWEREYYPIFEDAQEVGVFSRELLWVDSLGQTPPFVEIGGQKFEIVSRKTREFRASPGGRGNSFYFPWRSRFASNYFYVYRLKKAV